MPKAGLGEMFSSGGAATPTKEADLVCHSKTGGGFRDVDCHWAKDTHATAGSAVELWAADRSEPTNTFSWGVDTVLSVRFNPVEPDVFASCGSDRSIALYDVRTQTPLRKLVMQNKCTKLAWNPMEAFNFTVANEDTNLYSYDMRKLTVATCVHRDFVSAVLDVDYSPRGREFVAGSYDRTVRIFDYNGGHSRDVYHLKRMQRVFCTRFSMDGTYVLSGSDDMNVRCWKAEASAQLGTLLPREKRKKQYQAALKDRFKHMPEIKRIARHHHVPKAIHKAQKLRRVMTESETRKKKNRVEHSAPGAEKKGVSRGEKGSHRGGGGVDLVQSAHPRKTASRPLAHLKLSPTPCEGYRGAPEDRRRCPRFRRPPRLRRRPLPSSVAAPHLAEPPPPEP